MFYEIPLPTPASIRALEALSDVIHKHLQKNRKGYNATEWGGVRQSLDGTKGYLILPPENESVLSIEEKDYAKLYIRHEDYFEGSTV